MTDPASIAAGFREVGDRWGSLNVLVHTIGPGAGRFDDLDDADWDEAFDARHHVRRAERA